MKYIDLDVWGEEKDNPNGLAGYLICDPKNEVVLIEKTYCSCEFCKPFSNFPYRIFFSHAVDAYDYKKTLKNHNIFKIDQAPFWYLSELTTYPMKMIRAYSCVQ